MRQAAPRRPWRDATARGGGPSTGRLTQSRLAVTTTMCEPSRTCARRSPGSTSSSRPPAREPRKAGRPTRSRPSPERERLSTGATDRRRSRCGSAGRRSIARRSSVGSPPRTTASARRTLFEALAPVWRVVDGDGDEGSPYRRLLRASAARWAEHGSPIEANAVALGLPAGFARGDAPRDPRRVAVGRRSRADRAVGLLVRGWGRSATARPARAGRPAAGDQRRIPGLARGGSARPRDLVRHPAAARAPAGPGRVHARDGCLGGGPAADRSLDASPAVGLRDLRRGEPRQPSRAAPRERPRAAHGRHQDASCLPRLPGGERGLSRGHGRRPRLGRRRAGVAAPLAGRGGGTARGAPQPLWRGHARHLLGALRDRAPSTPRAAPERRLDRGDGRRPGLSSPIPNGRGGRSAAS